MKHISALFNRLRQIKNQHGFTMIELLIVISILGILAVAVLSAINPVEQINRGRDTGSRSDAEQLLSAIDRFNAFQGYYPWVAGAGALDLSRDWTSVTLTWLDNSSDNCVVLRNLSTQVNSLSPCKSSQELKQSFVDRVTKATYNPMYVYNRGQQGDSTYICFRPKSGAF